MKLNLVFRCQVKRINFQGKKYDELISLLFLFYKTYSLFYNMKHSISEAFKQQGRVIAALHSTLDPGWSLNRPHDDTQITKYIFFVTDLLQSLYPPHNKHSLFLSFFFSSTQRLASDGFTMT